MARKIPDRKTSDDVTVIRDFPGLVTNADPNDLPQGSAKVQVNVTATIYGEFRVRGGFRTVKFEA